MSNKELFIKIFEPLAIQFCEDKDDKKEDDLFQLSQQHLETVTVKSSSEDPEFLDHHLAEALICTESKHQTILLNLTMFKIAKNTPAASDRVVFVLLVKILHELCHCLTPVFNLWAGLAADSPTPDRLGTMYIGSSDVIGTTVSTYVSVCDKS